MNPTRVLELSGFKLMTLTGFDSGVLSFDLPGFEAVLAELGVSPVTVVSVRRFCADDTYLIFYQRKGARNMRILELGNEGSVNPLLEIHVTDQSGPGGANHEYEIYRKHEGDTPDELYTKISFQNGAIQEAGINGITNEALLAIVIDRLEGFAAGPFPSEETNHALKHCRHALLAMESRTKERVERGVEGKHEV